MVEPINQIVLFSYCFLVGLVAGIVYLFCKILKTLAKNNVFVGFSLDFAVFMFAGLGLFIMFFNLNGAQVSFAGIIAFILGFVITKIAFSYIFAFFNKIIGIKFAKFSFKNKKPAKSSS